MRNGWAATVTIAAVACLAGLTLLSRAPDEEVSPPVIFEKRSSYAQVDVADCVGTIVRNAFADFEPVISSKPSTISVHRAYVARDGSKLSIDQVGIGSMITYASKNGINSEQRDVLEWCAAMPGTTWIPRSLR